MTGFYSRIYNFRPTLVVCTIGLTIVLSFLRVVDAVKSQFKNPILGIMPASGVRSIWYKNVVLGRTGFISVPGVESIWYKNIVLGWTGFMPVPWVRSLWCETVVHGQDWDVQLC